MTRVAVFDMCGTLFRCNTLFAFTRWACPASKAAWWLDSAAVKIADSAFKRRNFRRSLALKAVSQYTDAELMRLGESFAAGELQNYVRRDAVSCLEELQQRGYITLLMSAAPDFLAKPVGRRLGFYAVFSSVYKDGELVFDMTGNKAEVLVKKARWDTLFVCTDNMTDVKLAELADELRVYGGRRKDEWRRLFEHGDVR